MKIILGIESTTDRLLPIETIIKSLNNDVRKIIMDDFSLHSSHLGIFLDRVSSHARRSDYNRRKILELESLIREFEPDLIFFIDLPVRIFSVEEFANLSQNRKIRVFFVDSLKQHLEIDAYMQFCDKVFSFDRNDAERLNAQYLPVGYAPSYEMEFNPNLERPIDISFVGTLFKNRLRMLEPLAKFARESGRSLRVFSPAFKRKNFWKRPIFMKRFPNLIQCIENGFVSSDRAAEIYSKSKICLNIHMSDASSPNPRTFDILATGSFQLIDSRPHYGILSPEQDLATFRSVEDLIERVEYFLNHEEERIEIARNGWKKVVPRFRLANCLEEILS